MISSWATWVAFVRSFKDMPIELGDVVRDFYHYMYELVVGEPQGSCYVGYEGIVVNSLVFICPFQREEFCQIRKDRDDARGRLKRLESYLERRFEALAAHEATRAANALETENQSQNGSDGDSGNGNGGNGNGRNENPYENVRGDRPVARDVTTRTSLNVPIIRNARECLKLKISRVKPDGVPKWSSEEGRIVDAIQIANNLMDKKLKGYVVKNAKNKSRLNNNYGNNRGQQPPFKRQNTGGQNVARKPMLGRVEHQDISGWIVQSQNQNRGNKTRVPDAKGKAYVLGEAVMSSASSAVTYTSVYTDSEPGRAFWGADDEEIPEGGIPRVIVLGYDGLPIQPVAPPSPDYIPGLEDPQTPPVPQDEDEREPMFVQAHDPDYVPEPIYPEYIPLEDEHEFPAEEQPLPPVDSPTAEGWWIDIPMDGGDDGDDDDGDSSRDDANDEDEDDEDEEEEEEEHLAPADSAIVVPVDELTSISLPPEAEVERLLAMTTPSPSPPVSLSPPSTRERLARCTALPVHSSSGCPTQFQTLRIASTQALIDVVTTALPSPPLPPLPPLPSSLYIPPHVDYRDEIPESEQPPRKRLCLSTLGSRYEIGESSTARPTRGRWIDYRFVSTVDAEERRQGIRDVGYGIRDTWVDLAETVPEIAPVTLVKVNTRVTELAELHEHDTQDLYALLVGC
ncbi:hypothetical protein Tco_1386119 [Tanacetum coccineum]